MVYKIIKLIVNLTNNHQIKISLYLCFLTFFNLNISEAAIWKNPPSEKEEIASKEKLKQSKVIQSFDIIIDAKAAKRLKRLPWEYNFLNKDIWKNLNKQKCFFSINRRPIKNKRVELMASGTLEIKNGTVFFTSNSWRTRGMSSSDYLKNESNLKILRNGVPVGKMPYFHLFINQGEVARPPLYVELSKEREKGETDTVEGYYSFYVDDWQEGIFNIRNCSS